MSDGPEADEADQTLSERVAALEARVRDLEDERLQTAASFTNVAGLLRWITAAEVARAEGYYKVIGSPEFAILMAGVTAGAQGERGDAEATNAPRREQT